MAGTKEHNDPLTLIKLLTPEQFPFQGTGEELAQTIVWNHPDLTRDGQEFCNLALYGATHGVYYVVAFPLHGNDVHSVVTGLDVRQRIISVPIVDAHDIVSVLQIPRDMNITYGIVTVDPYAPPTT